MLYILMLTLLVGAINLKMGKYIDVNTIIYAKNG